MADLRVPQDHLPKAEATGKNVTVDFEGDEYKIAPSSEWDIDAVEAAEEGRVVTSCKLILGAEQWKKFRAKHRTLGDLERFMEATGELMGGNL